MQTNVNFSESKLSALEVAGVRNESINKVYISSFKCSKISGSCKFGTERGGTYLSSNCVGHFIYQTDIQTNLQSDKYKLHGGTNSNSFMKYLS